MSGIIQKISYCVQKQNYELKHCEDGDWKDDVLQVAIQTEPITVECEKMSCEWKNNTDKAIICQLSICFQTDFPFTHYIIPGVSINGNYWGKGNEPKGLLCEGEPWVFDYRRTTIPACTISENKENYFALMASDENEESLQASCAMVPQTDGTMVHCLLYPCIERPKTYCTRDGYTDAHEAFLTIQPGASMKTTFFAISGKPILENFAAANVQNIALDLLGKPFLPIYTTGQIQELACEFAKRLIMPVNGRKLFGIGQLPDANGVFQNANGNEFGWCGQNGMYAKLFLERGLRMHDTQLVEIAVNNLDAWSHEAVGKTGLVHTHYHWMLEGNNTEDTCNLGFAIYELTQAARIAKQHGIDKKNWLKAAKSTADFLIAHYSEQYGFGKSWDAETGACKDPQGTIGAYVIPGLVVLWQETKEEIYLEMAKKACRFYRDRDLKVFCCTAGALDTYCIDKESSGPILVGSLLLYEVKPSEEWLECAKMAGWYFCSWMFHHDGIARPGSDFDVYGYRTLGGTSVSAQHHHIDPWGALVVPQMIRLYQITGEAHWKKRADLMWANAIQNIAPKEGKEIHGHVRAAGAQNEGYHHCCWGDEGAPGYINEWLVAWPQAFCWNTAVQVSDELLREEL